MSIDRRNFIRASLGSVALGALATYSHAGILQTKSQKPASAKKKLALNLSFQEGIAPGESLNEKLDVMEKLGVTGLEIGGRGLANRVDEIQQALKGRNIRVSAICAGFSGFILSEQDNVRQECIDTMHEIITAAGKLGSLGVIIVPVFNHQTPSKPHTQETRDFLCQQLAAMGEVAVKNNTSIILEPLNRKEAFYLRQVADAASICRDINNPGVKCMGDFWHMTWEEACDTAAFLSAGTHLQHVHVASRKRRAMPGEDGDADNYVAGFKGLKMLGYDKYVSFECGLKGTDRLAAVTHAVKLLNEQWKKA